MPEKVLEYGLAGLVMAGTFYLVVQPLVRGVLGQLERAQEEISAQREERMQVCARHHEFHRAMQEAMQGLLRSVDALVRRANGGG